MPDRPDTCANCGAPIPRNAHACPECGADERTGWADQSIYDGLDLPADEETLRADDKLRQKLNSRARLWWIVALIVTVLITAVLLGFR